MSDNTQIFSESNTIKNALDEGTRRWQLGSLDIIEIIKQTLRGYHYDECEKSWVKISEPWANDEGISRISSIISFYINKNVQLSYFEPETIKKITIEFSKKLSIIFEYCYKDFGLAKIYTPLLFDMIIDEVYSGLCRGRFGKESQFIENTESIRTIATEGGKQENINPISRIPFLGGRFK